MQDETQNPGAEAAGDDEIEMPPDLAEIETPPEDHFDEVL